jgi:two-component sensor histidine kinase
MLLAISQTRSVQDEDYAHLHAYFVDLMSVYSNYSVLLAANSSGTVIASGAKRTGYSLSDRSYFQQALDADRFSFGGFIVSKSTGIPSIPLSLPVHDRRGNTIILIALYNLAKYGEDLSLESLPKNTMVEFFDGHGLRLFSNDGSARIGQNVSPALYEKARSSHSFEASRVLINGRDFLVSSGSLSANGNDVYVTVRVPWSIVREEATAPVYKMLVVMCITLILAFFLSLALAGRLFVSRIEKLTTYTRLLASGESVVLTEDHPTRDEITDLIESFNSMSIALAKRDQENRQTLQEKEVLLHELQQRISDNLQILSSLVNLQIDHASEGPVRRSLMTTHSRVMALALVYETFYRFSDPSRVDMQQYCTGLCSFLIALYADVGSEISYVVSGEELSLSFDKALPIALILNELISNSILHAFPIGSHGTIEISFNHRSSSMTGMHIIDNGIGLKGDIHGNDTLGFEMIEALVEQIHGALSINSVEQGTDIGIRFPSC